MPHRPEDRLKRRLAKQDASAITMMERAHWRRVFLAIYRSHKDWMSNCNIMKAIDDVFRLVVGELRQAELNGNIDDIDMHTLINDSTATIVYDHWKNSQTNIK